jgi:hypothetical protein
VVHASMRDGGLLEDVLQLGMRPCCFKFVLESLCTLLYLRLSCLAAPPGGR